MALLPQLRRMYSHAQSQEQLLGMRDRSCSQKSKQRNLHKPLTCMTRQNPELDLGQEPAQHEIRRAGPLQEEGQGLGELRCGWG